MDAAGRGVQRTSRIVARNGRDYYLLPLDEIFAIQAEGQTVWILTEDRKYRATESVATLEQRLAGTEFQLMHRGSLINVNKIRKMSCLSNRRWLLTLTNGITITVSKRQAHLLQNMLE